MKPVLSSRCAIAALMLVFGAFSYAVGQTSSPTPDPFAVQLTSSPARFTSFASDITANGRFVVFESNGDLATQNRNNADGNREIFLIDYAQRRIFQITNTKNVQKPAASPTPTPSPSASPTPSPSPTPADPAQIQIEISNNRPTISYEPELVGGKRVYTIVLSSNAPNPATADAVDPASSDFALDGNQEIWVYQFEALEVSDLSSGDEAPVQDFSAGTFQRITKTKTSRPIRTGINPPDVVDDNREATISDKGDIIAFISTRDLVPGVGNADFNPELFFASRTAADWASSTFAQGTNTKDEIVGPKLFSRFQQNPSLSADGSVVAFLSSANLTSNNDDDGSGHGNGEVFLANFTGSGLSNIRQVTRTKTDATTATVNVLSPGRRLSRDGAMVAFDSLAEDPKANSATNTSFLAVFVYNVSADTFTRIGPRALVSPGDVIHFPTFTDYNSSLAPGTLVFASALNFKADGTFPPADQDSTTGLNPVPSGTIRPTQIFSTALPAANAFTRLTKNPSISGVAGIRPMASNTVKRIAFSLGGTELGGGNADNSVELFYLLTPTVTTESAAALSYFTWPSNFPVPAATPAASPSPSPTPTPTPGAAGAGLAPGEFSIIRSTVALAPSDKAAVGGSEIDRSPILPIELNGVSVSVNGAAAGLYFVGSASKEIHFVVPIGLSPGIATVVVNNNGTVLRGFVQIVVSQPDIFTSTRDAGGRAVVCNVTNTAVSGCLGEPFTVMTPDSTGTPKPTVLEIHLTGVRNVVASEAKVSIVTSSGTTDINANTVLSNPNMFGEDLITFTLPSSLAGAGDVPIIVTVTKSGGTFTSRAAATAPHIQIN